MGDWDGGCAAYGIERQEGSGHGTVVWSLGGAEHNGEGIGGVRMLRTWE